MILKPSTAFLTLLALAFAAPGESAEAAEAADAVEASKSGESGESQTPEYFPVREILPDTVIAHSRPDGAWLNTCLNTTSNEPLYIYSRGTGSSLYGQTLLYKFTFLEDTRNRRCWLELSTQYPVWNTSPVVQVDVFTTRTLAVCNAGSTANNRGVSIGRLEVPTYGISSWTTRNTNWLTRKTPCPAPGTVQGFEFVSVGTNAGVAFPQRDLT
ncbi:hypothetical protein QBC43DRAFT_321375 [Cladorrhinum sp. PSN259]|nr:hypothetical protein QBC43DRAFT_321375 [Cladorrhinum sp. PSN259]